MSGSASLNLMASALITIRSSRSWVRRDGCGLSGRASLHGSEGGHRVLRREFAEDASLVERLAMNEAGSETPSGHPNIIDIIDVGRLPSGIPYLVMESFRRPQPGPAGIENERVMRLGETLNVGIQTASASARRTPRGSSTGPRAGQSVPHRRQAGELDAGQGARLGSPSSVGTYGAAAPRRRAAPSWERRPHVLQSSAAGRRRD